MCPQMCPQVGRKAATVNYDANVYRWQDARDARMKEWCRRKEAGLRPGPIPDCRTSWRGPRWRQGHFVVIDRLLPPGYPIQFLGDEAVYVAGPAGAMNRRYAISEVLFSRNQARRALHAARKRYPGARLTTCWWCPDSTDLQEVRKVWGAGTIDMDRLVKVDAS